MKFSIVMPSFLGQYHGAATDRAAKFERAILSCLNQTYSDFELIVVADGCDETVSIIEQKYSNENISCYLIQKQKLWSGQVRNVGIKNAIGEYIVYCDTDDVLGKNHLEILSGEVKDYDWVYFNDYRMKNGNLVERGCDIYQRGQNGTSNYIHKKSLDVFWRDSSYAHDWHFLQDLKIKSDNFIKVKTPEYFCCHIPFAYEI